MNQDLQTPSPQVQRSPGPTRQSIPVRERSPARSNHVDEDDDGFFGKHRMKLIVLAVLVVGTALYFLPKPGPSAPPPRKVERVVSITVPPPPPPVKPPPPPPPQKVEPPKEKMVKETQPREAKAEPKPQPKADPPPAALALSIKGDGPGMAGLSSSGTGLGGGTGVGSGTGSGSTGSKFGWYRAGAAKDRDRSECESADQEFLDRQAGSPHLARRLGADHARFADEINRQQRRG